MTYQSFKRIFDVIVASVLFLVLLPVIVIVGLVVWLDVGWPVIFVQDRIAQGGGVFALFKFRTMKDSYDSSGNLLSDIDRLTMLGKFFRSTSLDELPQLVNIIRGDMSFIGPRPLLPEYLPLYTEGQSRRHEVLPGLTGWAQVRGRNLLSWEEKFDLDVYYVDNFSFWLDLKIALLTIRAVILCEGISSEGSATAERFKGSKNPVLAAVDPNRSKFSDERPKTSNY